MVHALFRSLVQLPGLQALGLSLGLLVALAGPASAQATWTGTTSSSWFEPTNWSTGSVPGTLTDVSIPVAINAPDVSSGTAQTRDLTVLPGALLTLSGSGSFEVHGDLTLAFSSPSTGSLDLVGVGNDLRLYGAWSQDAAGAVTSGGGRVLFDGTTSIAGSAVAIPKVTLVTGTLTLLAEVEVQDLVATSGASAGSFPFVLTDPAAELSLGTSLIHHVRIDAGTTTWDAGSVAELHVIGGTVFVPGSSGVTVTTLFDAAAGGIDFAGLSATLTINGDLVAASTFTFGDSFVNMAGTTSVTGPGGTTPKLNFLNFQSGTCTLLSPVRITGWVGSTGGTPTGEWIEAEASALLSVGTLHKVRVVGGNVRSNGSTMEQLELVGGTLEFVAGTTTRVLQTADLQAGTLTWLGPNKPKFELEGDLIASSAVSYGPGEIRMVGTTSITGPLGTVARVGGLNFVSGTCTLLTDVELDQSLVGSGGATTGGWLVSTGGAVSLQDSPGLPATIDRLRIQSGVAEVLGNLTVDYLELTGGVLKFPAGEAMTVNLQADLVAGQLEFVPSFFADSSLVVLGDVNHTATTGVASMSTKGSLVCHGVWTGTAPIDLGDSFVELAGSASVTGADPTFARLRLAAGATVSLLNRVVVTARLENAGGTSAGLWFELQDDGVVLATAEGGVHDLRITGGTTVSENATVDLLRLQGGTLEVQGGGSLVVESLLELVAGSLALDPLDTGITASLEVQGDVNMQATGPAAATGSGGTLRCEGLWFGNGFCDLGSSFAELGGGATVLGSQASFRRLRIADGSASMNVVVSVTEELVVAEDGSTSGFHPLEARPGLAGTLTYTGGGPVGELHVLEGTVVQDGGTTAVLRVFAGELRATSDCSVGSLHLQGGGLVCLEGATVSVTGDLNLTAGTLGFDAGDGSPALVEVAGTVTSAGVTAGAVVLPTGTLACRGAWIGTSPLDLGVAWVEVGGEAGSPTSLSGPALDFGRLRVGGAVDLLAPTTVSVRLEGAGASGTGDWFRLDGAATELATSAGSLHRVRVAGGVTRSFDAEVDELELVAGELILDATATLTVSAWLELIGGSLAFDSSGGQSSARLLAEGVAHQVGTTVGSTSHSDAVLAVAGQCMLDAHLDLGDARVELLPGSRVTGSAASLARLRVPLVSSVLGAPNIEVATTVTGSFQVGTGATLLVGALGTGSLVLTTPPVALDGRLELGPGAQLALSPSTDLAIGRAGSLSMLGTSTAPAEVVGTTGGWTMSVDGQLEGRQFVLRDIGSLVVGPSASVGPAGLIAGSFERGLGASPGALVDFGVLGDVDLIGIDFDGGPGDANLRRLPGAGLGQVTVRAFGGALGGEAFEDDPSQGVGDPDGLVAWLNTVEPDLLPLDLEGDPETVIGWLLRVDYSAVNQGGGTAVAPWIDRLWLTQNEVVGDADDVGLAKFTRATDLPGGELYEAGADILVPPVEEGEWRLALVQDNGGVVDEGGGEGNNTLLSAPFLITATPRPNLVAKPVELHGSPGRDEATGLGGTWQDRVYLSSDTTFGGDILLETFAITVGDQPGGVAAGAGYTEVREVVVPPGLSGSYHLIVRTDAIDEVAPESMEDDNVLVAPVPILVTQTDLPDLVGAFDPVTSPLGALFTGDEVEVTWTVTNADPDANGLGSMAGASLQRLWLSLDNVLDPADTLVAEQAFDGSVAPLGTFDGTGMVTLPATPGTWWLFGEADTALAIAESDDTNNRWEQILSVVLPGHEGSVSTSFVEGLASQAPGDLVVGLTGQSTVPGSIQLVPNAELTVRVRRGDTRRVFEVTTDAAGGYQLDFEPLVGETGLFTVFCDHPAVDEDPLAPQASFVLHDLQVSPGSLSEALVTGETRLVSLGLENPGSQALAGLGLTISGLPAHLAIQNESVPTSLAAGAADLLTFELVAVTDAPDPPGPSTPANLTLDLAFDLGGAPTVARSVPLDVWVTPFTPDPIARGLAPAVQLAGDGTSRVTFSLVNQGGAPLTGASFSIESAADRGLSCLAVEPFVPAVPASLGDLLPGDGRTIAFDVLAGACAALGPGVSLTAYTITVTANEGTWTYPVDLILTSTPSTSLTVFVEDVGTWWLSNGVPIPGNGPKVWGATVTLSDSTGAQTVLQTGPTGRARFLGIEPVWYDMTIAPPDSGGAATHVTWRAPVQVLTGQDTEVRTYLPSAPAKVELTAVESAAGLLDFSVTATPQGTLSAGELLVSVGQLLDLDMAVGATTQYELTLTNGGAATVSGIELFAPDLAGFDLEPEFLSLGDLAKGQSQTVVLTATRTGAGDPCDLHAAGGHGLRYHVVTAEPIWRWTPLLLAAPDELGPCASAVGGGAAPAVLPAPLAPPSLAPMPVLPPAPYLGSRGLGTLGRPVAPLPADLLLSL
ncbi:MAG: hypothetical protein P1V81_16075 [Planctomycetota bacterium]|nr:hypothetical protein [Planctomycetota bacterium]